MEKWLGKYRIPSARASWWDYANDGSYFITICTDKRQHFFGACKDGKMQLSTIGAIVQGFWYEIPKHFPFVELGAFVVMPNHVHGVLILKNETNSAGSEPAPVEIGHCPISTPTISTTPTIPMTPITPAQKRIGNQGKNTVSSIVGSFKSVCTKHINLVLPNEKFGWQKLFWDNIIQDEQALLIITDYILNNPINWEKDKFHQPE